jgi:uncharacterized Tic20 family protein
MGVADELEKLQQLYQSGAINDDELALAKHRLLSGHPVPAEPAPAAGPADVEAQTRQWAVFLHLSVFAGYVVPLAGLVVPIVIWQLKKAELPGLDAHGKVVVNWIISSILYAVVSVVLVFVLIGIPMLVALGVLCVVFPIIGAVKANEGQVWKYPLSIPFLS